MKFLSFVLLLSLGVCSTERILYKCCPNDQTLNENGECVFEVISTNVSVIPTDDVDSPSAYFRDDNRTHCGYWDSMLIDWNATDRFSLADNGSLVLYSPTVGNGTVHHIFDPGEFCSDVISPSRRRVVKLCPCDKLICLRKCCPAGQVYNFSSGPRCIKSKDSKWYLNLIASSSSVDANLKYDVLDGRMPKCKGFHNFASTAFIPPELLNSFWWEYPTGKAFQGRQLCKDLVHGGRFEISIICEEISTWDRVLKPLWHIPAAILLVLTLVILVLCPELRAGMHGRAMFCHAIALLIVNVVLAFNAKHTFFGVRHETYVVLRKCADIIVLYAVWAAAFWLNSICINIGLGFRTNSTVRRAEEEKRKFIWFSLYSWISPLIITIIVVVLRMLPHTKVPFLYKPTMIETRGGHYELEGLLKLTSFAYYFAPMSGLLVINLVMFAFTTRKVLSLRRSSRMLTKHQPSNSSNGNGEKKMVKKVSTTDTSNMVNESSSLMENTKSMLLYVRLLWTMGVLEMVVEIATWATNHYFWYEATMDVVDLLRAACIFSLTCCKRRVVRQLRDRLKDCALLRTLLPRRSEEYEMGSAGTSSTSARARRSSKSTTGS